MISKNTLILAFVILSLKGFTQVVTWNPAFPVANDSVEVTFNAAQGNAALANLTGDVYAHTGVLTNLSTSGSNWRYVKTAWGTNTPETKMQSLGNNLYRIKYHVRNYYGVPITETILKLAFVFRNSTGSIVGKTSTGGDIFIPVFSTSLNCYISDPVYTAAGIPALSPLNVPISVTGLASASATLSFYLNNVFVSQGTGTSFTTNVTPTTPGTNWVKLSVSDGITTVLDSFSFIVNPPINVLPLPSGASDGVTYVNDSTVILSLFAPFKTSVYVLGGFNNFIAQPSGFMNRTPDGKTYWIQLNGLTPGQEYVYQYLIDGNLKIADPYTEKVLDPSNDGSIGNLTYPNPTPYPSTKTSGIASVFQTAQQPYNWQVTNFVKPKKTDLFIYELLIRDFVLAHNYKTLIDTLDYLDNLGVNAIELMPINEFEANQSWGYNPSYYFAPDKYYGTRDKLREFIDACHQRGIAVILDIALNHSFGQSPMVQMYWDAANNRPAANSPWFNPIAKHDFNVGFDFNHETAETKYFTKKVLDHWITKYKIDGFRFDLAKGFTQTNTLGNTGLWSQYDLSRINIWKDYYDHIHLTDPTNYTILEYFADNSEETVLANYGCMFWGNLVNSYNQNTMGYSSNSDLSWGSYKSRNWNAPHLVTYMESHDEERLMFKNIQFGAVNGAYNTKDTTLALKRMEAAAAFFFTIPGPKMIWQFGELGYDISINFSCRVCNKPIKWNYFLNPHRKRLYDIYSALAKFKINQPAMESANYTMNVGNYFMKSIHINHSNTNITVIGNFDVNGGNINPAFQSTGYWFDYLTGDSILVTNTTANIFLQAGEYHIYTSIKVPLPNTITSIFEPIEKTQIGAVSIYPNPSSENARIRFDANQQSSVSVTIFDLMGNEVSSIANERNLPAGQYEWVWNLQNKGGARVAKGIYFVQVIQNGKTKTGKLLVD
jgi:hypothetical protein